MEIITIAPFSHLQASCPARQLVGLQQLVDGIGYNLELSDADRQYLRELSLNQACNVEKNLQRVASKWQRSLPRAQYLDVDWQAWSKLFRDVALRDYAADTELSAHLVSIAQTLSQIAHVIDHPGTQLLIDLYQKYLSRMRSSLADQLQELEEWITHRLPRKSQLRQRRLQERQSALLEQLIDSGFLSHARDGAGLQLTPEEALDELMCDASPDAQLVADYIYRYHCHINLDQIRAFFLYVLLTERIEQELNAPAQPLSSAPSTPSTPLQKGGTGEGLDPYHILHPDADPQLVQECVRQAEALIGDNQYKYAHLMKVMLDHQVLSIQQSDHDPFARTLELWGCAGGKRSDLIKASIRQRLRKIMNARQTPAGHTLSLYRTWPDTDPDRQICSQLASIFTQAGFEYPRSS